VRPVKAFPWYAWLLIGALPVTLVVGWVIRNDTIFLGALALMPLVGPLTLFYQVRADMGEHENHDTGW
jgi:hypothetical protein